MALPFCLNQSKFFKTTLELIWNHLGFQDPSFMLGYFGKYGFLKVNNIFFVARFLGRLLITYIQQPPSTKKWTSTLNVAILGITD